MAHLARRLTVSNNVNTDYIISGRYKFRIQDPAELAKHIFEDVDPGFRDRMEKGDFLVAGDNFGCGSSREQAPAALKASGIETVVARSFGRIFYRNAFNVGLCLVECETNYIDDMDELELDLENNLLHNLSKCFNVEIDPIPKLMRKFLENGGAIEYFKEHGGFEDLA